MTLSERAWRLLSFWTTFERPVSRSAYLRHGLLLAAVKYAVDVTLVAVATGTFWEPWSYLVSGPLLLESRLQAAPPWLGPALAFWTLPFLWIGVSMTMRRLLDAGRSAWWSLLFFLPLFNYGLMAILCLAGSRPSREPATPPSRESRRLPGALLSMAAGSALGLAMVQVSVLGFESYGLALFMGTPFIVGVVTAFLFCRRYPATVKETEEVVLMTTLLTTGFGFALGFEGAVCLLMMLPLTLVLAGMGGIMGRAITRMDGDSLGGASLALVVLPLMAAAEGATTAGPVREVRSAVDIDAPPEVVWDQVIAFSPIPEPDDLIFRLGVAYPTHAEIEGRGVGAIRYCVFSTGAFEEPITAWEPRRRLAFDVTRSPPPLRELTPAAVDPPHLEGYLRPLRGEFRLVELPGGGTRLEGSTWYEQRLRPDGYWVLFSDAIIRKIHRRVLEHIQAEAERGVDEVTDTAGRTGAVEGAVDLD